MKPKLVLGLSGGVDSAVAASLLRENYEVHCVFLDIGAEAGSAGDEAAALADQLGLTFERIDIREELEHFVCSEFTAEYLAGRTPLPCARCNPLVKFPALVSAGERIGAEVIATGHYARVTPGPEGRFYLRKGRPANDQSYMLARLTQALLRRTVFPLGNFEKSQVRAMASEMGLHAAQTPDSMEICFIPDGDYAAWLERRGAVPPPGDFVDGDGRVLGQHRGIHHYTIGQGRGLALSGPHRYFVSGIDADKNTVTLSDGSDLWARRVLCVRPHWIALDGLEEPQEVTVRFRHSRDETSGLIRPTEKGGVEVLLEEPARAPTPGQLAVFYRGDLVLGSAWIARACLGG